MSPIKHWHERAHDSAFGSRNPSMYACTFSKFVVNAAQSIYVNVDPALEYLLYHRRANR